ncbi:hypothetical protein M9H77_35905 [Catharanthus roseus]|uniref:Uncharacterized protein n=1 Tax=Catharanthus roseus TaxID=4058 RepID=A0ACB9ZU07_CATRO|nr:hypothetical protein M9H77_35905 [Catharanthus roseus]
MENISDSSWMFREVLMHKSTQQCSQLLKDLSWGPSKNVNTCSGYIVNRFQFHTRDRVETYFKEVQNDEIEIEWDSDEYCDEDSDKKTDEYSNVASSNNSDEDFDR